MHAPLMMTRSPLMRKPFVESQVTTRKPVVVTASSSPNLARTVYSSGWSGDHSRAPASSTANTASLSDVPVSDATVTPSFSTVTDTPPGSLVRTVTSATTGSRLMVRTRRPLMSMCFLSATYSLTGR